MGRTRQSCPKVAAPGKPDFHMGTTARVIRLSTRTQTLLNLSAIFMRRNPPLRMTGHGTGNGPAIWRALLFVLLLAAPPSRASDSTPPPEISAVTNEAYTPDSTQEEREKFAGASEWFPAKQPFLMPYLAKRDIPSEFCLQSGSVFPDPVISNFLQGVKTSASNVGVRYRIQQGFTYVGLGGVASGSSQLAYWSFSLRAIVAILSAPRAGFGLWLTAESSGHLELDSVSAGQSPRKNLGTIVNPAGAIGGPNGIALRQLALQLSMADGKFVLLAGVINQGRYLDRNIYADTARGQFLNSALVHDAVLPLAGRNLGLLAQWQPTKLFYAMFGIAANNQKTGHSALNDLSLDDMSYLLELGLTPADVFGLGPGVYRVQPFLSTVAGKTQPGFGIDLQQRLGKDSPFGYFARFGVGGAATTLYGAALQLGTGFSVRGPLAQLGLVPRLTNDYAGVGFVWSQPNASRRPAVHFNEYGVELMYVLQLTRTLSIQPDFQRIQNPANNAKSDTARVFQIQANLIW
jgi:porin